MRKTQARLDDVQAEALRMIALIEEIRRSAHAAALEEKLAAVATAGEAFADAVTALEEAYCGRRHDLALARAAKEAA